MRLSFSGDSGLAWQLYTYIQFLGLDNTDTWTMNDSMDLKITHRNPEGFTSGVYWRFDCVCRHSKTTTRNPNFSPLNPLSPLSPPLGMVVKNSTLTFSEVLDYDSNSSTAIVVLVSLHSSTDLKRVFFLRGNKSAKLLTFVVNADQMASGRALQISL